MDLLRKSLCASVVAQMPSSASVGWGRAGGSTADCNEQPHYVLNQGKYTMRPTSRISRTEELRTQ